MALKYFPPVSAIPLGSGLAVDSDGKLEATGGGGSGVSSITAGTGLTGGTITTSGTIAANFGTTAGTIAQGNDSRLSDARTPTAHTHAASDISSGTIATARLGSGTADATTYLRGDGTWATPSGGGGGGGFMPSVPGVAIKSGEYRVAYNGVSNTLTTLTPSLNRLYWVPFVATYPISIAKLGVVVGTSNATATCRVGFYASDSDGYPTGSALVDSGSLAASSTGIREASVLLTLDAGVQYWAAFVAQTAVTAWRGISQANLTAINHLPAATPPRSYIYINNVTGALPSVPGVTFWGSGTAPAVWMGA